MLGWKTLKIVVKPTNSPTHGQPNPRTIRFNVAFGPLVPTANIFAWVGIYFIQETDYKKLNPNKFSASTLLKKVGWVLPVGSLW